MARRHFGNDRQRVSWDNIPAFLLNLTANGTQVGTGFLGATAAFTVRRVRSTITLILEGSLSAGDDVSIGIGLAVISSDAAAAGAVPDPLGNSDYPWLWWRSQRLFMPGASTNATWVNPGGWGPACVQIEVDSKAQRRMKPLESLVWAIQYSNTTGNPPVSAFFGVSRVLLGLH